MFSPVPGIVLQNIPWPTLVVWNIYVAHWLGKVNSAVGITTRLWVARSGVPIPIGTREASSSPGLLDRSGNRPIPLLNEYLGPFRGLKRSEHEIHYSPPSRTYNNNEWSHIFSLSLYLHGVIRDQFKYYTFLSYYIIIIIIIIQWSLRDLRRYKG
jgi:hypothetical protein